MDLSNHEAQHPILRIEELWNLTAANLLVLEENSTLFGHSEPQNETIKRREPWMRMALIKNSNNTYQAILVERGRLVCETRTCLTPYIAAMAMFDYTSVQVGEALVQSRRSLRDGRPEVETVLNARREPSLDADQAMQMSDETETVEKKRSFDRKLRRLGSVDAEAYCCERHETKETTPFCSKVRKVLADGEVEVG